MGKLKTYSPSVWGLLKYGYDKITGLTELPEQESVIRDLGGSPDRSGKTHEERNKDYFHPIWGASERWKASMNNDTNPFVGIGRTIVPAVVFGAGAYYTPLLIGGAVRATPHVVKATMSHPHLVGKVAKTGALNFGRSLAKGIIGGKAVDMGTETFTGKDWGEFIAPYLGTSEAVADWTNPGYLLGGKNLGITDAIKTYRSNKKLLPSLREKGVQLDLQIQEIERRKQVLDNAIKLLRDVKSLAYQKYDDARFEAEKAEDLVSKYRPISKAFLTDRRRSIALHNKLFQGDISTEGRTLAIDVGETPTTLVTEHPGVSMPVTFTNNTGASSSASVQILPKSTGPVTIAGQEFPFVFENGKLVPKNKQILLSLNNRFGSIISGDTSELQKGIGDYVTLLENTMGEDGVVAGSLVHYKNGILKGTQTETGIIGPADTEIYTTRARLPQLLEKLQFNSSRNNSTGGIKGTSSHTFRNRDAAHNGVDTEINIIEADADGNATGKIAHQIYRASWPYRYSRMLYDATMSGKGVPVESMSLPIKAEELLLYLKLNPDAMLQHLLVDMVGMETFTKPLNVKATKRLFSVLFNPDNGAPEKLHNAIQTHGIYNLGARFKLGSQMYPNLTFKDLAANKQFLKTVYNLSEEEATAMALNPTIMRNAFDIYHFLHSTGTRLLGNDVITDVASNGMPLHDARIEMFTGNGAFSGGTGSGPGLNTTLLNPFGGWHPGTSSRAGIDRNILAISLRPITYRPDLIKTPMDVVNLVERLKLYPRDPNIIAEELAGDVRDKSYPYTYDTLKMLEIRDLSEQMDMPMYLGMHSYLFGYSGGFAKPIAAGARYTTETDHAELGSLFKDIAEGGGSRAYKLEVKTAPKEVQEYIETLASQGKENVAEFIEKWKGMTPKERAEVLRNSYVTVSKEGQPYMDLKLMEKVPRLVKRRPYDYSYASTNMRPADVEMNMSASDMQERIRYLTAQRKEFDNFGIKTNDEKAKVVQSLGEANRLWDKYVKFYKDLRTKAYSAKEEAGKARRTLETASKRLKDLSGRLVALLVSLSSKLKGLRSMNNRDIDHIVYGNKNIIRDLKEKGIVTGALGTIGLLIHAATQSSRRFSREEHLHAVREAQGLEDPSNGYLEYMLSEEGVPYKQIEIKLKEAKKLYLSKIALKKLKGGKICLLPRKK